MLRISAFVISALLLLTFVAATFHEGEAESDYSNDIYESDTSLANSSAGTAGDSRDTQFMDNTTSGTTSTTVTDNTIVGTDATLTVGGDDTSADNGTNGWIDVEIVDDSMSTNTTTMDTTSGSSETSRGTEMNTIQIVQVDNDEIAIVSGNVNATTDLEVSVEGTSAGQSTLVVNLSNGGQEQILVTPDRAYVIALSQTNISCPNGESVAAYQSSDIELQEHTINNEKTLVYEVTARRAATLLFIFNSEVPVTTDVDAQTGAVVDVRRPWWNFLAREKDIASVCRDMAGSIETNTSITSPGESDSSADYFQ